MRRVRDVTAAPKLDYAPPATEPELYVRLLITHRDFAGLGVGARLLEHAADLARVDGLGMLRVDCYLLLP